MSATNPWLPGIDPGGPAAPADQLHPQPSPRLTGAAAPQPGGGVATTDQLPPLFTAAADQLWVMGVHGGAGETTLAHALDAVSTDHRWPSATEPPALLLVARTNAAGLRRLQRLSASWAAGRLPRVNLVGAVLVADAPGRLPRPLEELAGLVAGGVPHTWRLAWAEELRVGADLAPIESRRLRKTRREIESVVTTSKERNR